MLYRVLSPFLVAPLLLIAVNSSAEVYKVIDKDGKVIYTDQKPAANGGEVIEVETDPKANTMDPIPDLKQKQQERQAEREEKKKAYKERYKAWKEKYDSAKKALAKAEKALREVEPGEEDFIGYRTASGGFAARPSEEYLRRVEGMEENVKKLRKKLKDLRKRKPKISSTY